MIGAVIDYLRNAGVAFRLASYPSPEPSEKIARACLRGPLLVESRVVLAESEIVLVCTRLGAPIELATLAPLVGCAARDCRVATAQDATGDAMGPLPPLGGLLGLPLFVDSEIPVHSKLVFRAFAVNDYIEMAYRDLAWLERPRVVSIKKRSASLRPS